MYSSRREAIYNRRFASEQSRPHGCSGWGRDCSQRKLSPTFPVSDDRMRSIRRPPMNLDSIRPDVRYMSIQPIGDRLAMVLYPAVLESLYERCPV